MKLAAAQCQDSRDRNQMHYTWILFSVSAIEKSLSENIFDSDYILWVAVEGWSFTCDSR